jgi:hypothetical protein
MSFERKKAMTNEREKITGALDSIQTAHCLNHHKTIVEKKSGGLGALSITTQARNIRR